MKGHWIQYSADELAFIQSVSKWPRAEAHAAFCQKFGRDDVTMSNLHSLCKRKGWMTGRTGCFAKGQTPPNKGKRCAEGTGGRHPNARRTQFKKGNLPHNTKFLGHERVSKDGYVEISIDQPNPHTGYERRYVLKHRWLWEQANGPLPEGYALKCLSDDKTNCDPDNWAPVERAMLPLLNGGRHKRHLAYDDAAPEIKPAVMSQAKLRRKLAKLRKEIAA